MRMEFMIRVFTNTVRGKKSDGVGGRGVFEEYTS